MSSVVRALWVWVLCGFLGPAVASEGPLSAYRHAGTAGLELSLGGFQGRVPDALLDSFYQQHGTLRGRGPSVDVGWYREGFLLRLSAHHLTVTTPDGVWLEKGKDKQDAVWAEQDLRLWGAELAFCYEFVVTRAIRLMTGIGYGAILREGSLVMYPTEGTASAS
ncbi:MAG: hypothetical protein QGG40_17480, partial [Myxococcota bacterium]|nr:hypothetical protein [Myxococcota bacterium]